MSDTNFANGTYVPTPWLQDINNSTYRGVLQTFSVAGGTANALLLTHTVPWTSVQDGQLLSFRAVFTNTGACTIGVDGLSVVPLVSALGPLSASALLENRIYLAQYNAALQAWVLINTSATGASGAVDPSAKYTEGAAGNNIADDTAALQALTAIVGANLRIEAGKYKITGSSGIGALSLNYNTTNLYAFDGPQVAQLYGVGAQNSVLCPSTAGQYAVEQSGGQSPSIAEVTYKDFAISGRNNPGNVHGLLLNITQIQTIDSMRFEQLGNGMLVNSVEALTLRKSIFVGCTNGVVYETSNPYDTGTGLNASTLQDCVFDTCSGNGLWVQSYASTLNVLGCTLQGIGTQGVSGTAAINLTVTGADGSNGINVHGCYFEGNAGDADIKIVNTSGNRMVHTITGCNFNRISSSSYVTNNIVSTGPNTIVLIGCSFKGFGTYSPNASRQYLSGDANTTFILIGCDLDSSLESTSAPAQLTGQGSYMVGVPTSTPSISASYGILPYSTTATGAAGAGLFSAYGGGIKVMQAGRYRVMMSASMRPSGQGEFAVGIGINGTTNYAGANQTYYSGGGTALDMQAVGFVALSAGDVLYPVAAAAPGAVLNSSSINFLSVEGPLP